MMLVNITLLSFICIIRQHTRPKAQQLCSGKGVMSFHQLLRGLLPVAVCSSRWCVPVSQSLLIGWRNKSLSWPEYVVCPSPEGFLSFLVFQHTVPKFLLSVLSTHFCLKGSLLFLFFFSVRDNLFLFFLRGISLNSQFKLGLSETGLRWKPHCDRPSSWLLCAVTHRRGGISSYSGRCWVFTVQLARVQKAERAWLLLSALALLHSSKCRCHCMCHRTYEGRFASSAESPCSLFVTDSYLTASYSINRVTRVGNHRTRSGFRRVF